MTRYIPSRNYFTAGIVAFVLAIVSGWFAMRWTPSVVPTFLFLITSCVLTFLAGRPPVEIHPHHIRIGAKTIAWSDIRAVDRTGWISPLVVFLTVTGNRRVVLIYPGDLERSKALLRHLRRCAHDATIDGIPYREFWGEPVIAGSDEPARLGKKPLVSPKYPLLRPQDEAEVERLYQRLKTVGRLDPKSDEG